MPLLQNRVAAKFIDFLVIVHFPRLTSVPFLTYSGCLSSLTPSWNIGNQVISFLTIVTTFKEFTQSDAIFNQYVIRQHEATMEAAFDRRYIMSILSSETKRGGFRTFDFRVFICWISIFYQALLSDMPLCLSLSCQINFILVSSPTNTLK